MIQALLPLSCPSFHRKNTASAPGGQAHISCPPEIVSSGVDTLLLSLSASVPDTLIEQLKEAKKDLQARTDNHQFVQFGVTELFSWNLQRMGTKFFPYMLKSGDCTLCISPRSAGSSIPSMQVSFGSMACNNDLPSLLKSLRLWLKHHGIEVVEEKVSRIDIYADTTFNIKRLSLGNQSRFVTQAEKTALYYSNRVLSGMQVGSGDIVFRAYNKIQEMTDKCASHKAEFFQAIWGNVQHVTRCEFQLRREGIKSIMPNVTNLSSVIDALPSIWRYLTESWFRQTARPVDRKNNNQTREDSSAWWLIVQSAFDAPAHPAAIRNKKLKNINISALLDQASGIMQTICAASGIVPKDLFAMLAFSAQCIQDSIAEKFDEPGFISKYLGRTAGASVSF